MSRRRLRNQRAALEGAEQADHLAKPPYYVITNGERSATGYEALVLRSHRHGVSGVLTVFSSTENAQKYIHDVVIPALGRGRGWRVARLPTWMDILGFLRSCPGLRYLCMNPVRLPDLAVCHDLAVLMPMFEFLASDPANN